MATRKKIGLYYYNTEQWIAGTYYINNLISALKTLDDTKKPDIYVITDIQSSFDQLKNITSYPYLYIAPQFNSKFFERIINKLSMKILSKYIIYPNEYNKYDVIYYNPNIKNIKNGLYWIPDLQEKYYPEYFDDAELATREKERYSLAMSENHVVFSSQSALDDFNKYYKNNRCIKHVLNFAVSIPKSDKYDYRSIKKKYGLPEKYYLCSNQFWRHKNHFLILKAIKNLRDKYQKNINVVFTGFESDPRYPDHMHQIYKYLVENGLVEQTRLLGFIKREDQLRIAKNSIAMIQPSLFEGWSTVVEDAKALKVNIILSKIPVHIEQTVDYHCKMFDPHSCEELSNILLSYNEPKSDNKQGPDYNISIKKYAEQFIAIVDRCTG